MKRSTLIAIFASLLFAGSLQAASDYLLELDGIKGESKDDKHRDTIEIQSFSWGVSNTGTAAGGGKVSLQDFHFVANSGKATPQLLLACASGKRISKGILYVRKAGERPLEYYKITLEDCLISSLQQAGPTTPPSPTTGGDTTPAEKVVITFNSITVEHTGDDGSVTTGGATATPAQ